jgi:hypothetical protein
MNAGTIERPALYYVVDLMRQRVPAPLIAYQLGLSEGETRRLTQRARHLWPDLPYPLHMSSHGTDAVRLLSAQIDRASQLMREGHTLPEIAADLGVTHYEARSIAYRVRHLHPDCRADATADARAARLGWSADRIEAHLDCGLRLARQLRALRWHGGQPLPDGYALLLEDYHLGRRYGVASTVVARWRSTGWTPDASPPLTSTETRRLRQAQRAAMLAEERAALADRHAVEVDHVAAIRRSRSAARAAEVARREARRADERASAKARRDAEREQRAAARAERAEAAQVARAERAASAAAQVAEARARAEAASRRCEEPQGQTLPEPAAHLPPAARAVLASLSAGIMALSAATLARRTGLAAATVRESLRQLVAAGLVEQAGKRAQGMTYRPTTGGTDAD